MRVLCLGLLLCSWLQAAPPVVDALYPAGGMRGKEIPVELVGKVTEEGLSFWSSDPGITYELVEEKRILRVAATCPLGAHWLRFSNAEGASLPQLFVVGDLEECEEVEPNNQVREAQKIADWPALVNGRLAKSEDVDVYALSLSKGQSIRAEVVAYRIDSPIDPLLRLVDAQGNQLAWNHDRYDSLDAQLDYTAGAAGDYYLMVAGFVYPPAARSRFEGSSQTVYRLSIRDAVSLDEREGLALKEEEACTDLPAEKGVTYEIAVRSLNSPLDPWLEVRDSEGKVLAKNDDSDGVDASLSWKAPDTASYTIALGDLLGGGGDDYRYSLTMEKAKPSFDVTVAEHFLCLPVGEAKELSLSIARKNGHDRPVEVSLIDLPPECVAPSVTLTPEQKERKLSIEGKAPVSARIRLRASDGDVTQDVTYQVKGASTDQGALLRNALTDILLISK